MRRQLNKPAVRLLTALMIVLNFVGVYCLWRAAGASWKSNAVTQRARSPPVAAEKITEFQPAPRNSFAHILTRPIFSPSRKPWSAPEKVAKAAPTDQARVAISLSGIASAGRVKRAFLAVAGKGDGDWLSEGNKFDGWTVGKIGESNVTLENGAQTITLNLYPGER